MSDIDIMNVKDSFLTDWDIKILLKHGFENRNLNKEEVKNMLILHEMARVFNFDRKISLGIGNKSSQNCIAKIYDSVWASFTIDEKSLISNYIAFRNSKDACEEIIRKSTFSYETNRVIRYFDNAVEKDYLISALKKFANRHNYHVVDDEKELTKKLK